MASTVKYRQFSDLTRRRKLELLKGIAASALDAYPLAVSAIRFYAEHSNVLYRVTATDGSNYLLKITRPGDHTLEETVAAFEWLRAVNKQADIPMMRVVPARDGRLVVMVTSDKIGDPRYCTVCEWIPGRVLKGRESEPLAEKWGALSAKLHKFSSSCKVKPVPKLMIWDKVFYWEEEVLFSPEYAAILPQETAKVFAAAVEWLRPHIKALYGGAERPRLIHGDLHPDNVKVDRNSVWGIDVEDLMYGYPIQDIAISLFHIRNHPRFDRLCSAFSRGYKKYAPWPLEKIGDLNPYFAARYLMFSNYIVGLKDFEADVPTALRRYGVIIEELMSG